MNRILSYMKPTRLLVVLALVVLFAGCIGPSSPPEQFSGDNINRTETTLSNANSFTLEGNDTAGVNESIRVTYDRGDNKARYIERRGGELEVDQYVTRDRVYTWDYREPTFDDRSGPIEEVPAQELASIFLYNKSVNRTGTTMFNGKEVGVYKLTGERAASLVDDVRVYDVTNATVTTYVNAQGYIVYQSYQDQTASRVTLRLTDVGSTTVREPEWTEGAVSADIPPPRAGITSETNDNGTMTFTVVDDGNLDSFYVRTDDGVRAVAPNGEPITNQNPSVGDTFVVDLRTDEYDASRGQSVDIEVVGRNDGREAVVASVRP